MFEINLSVALTAAVETAYVAAPESEAWMAVVDLRLNPNTDFYCSKLLLLLFHKRPGSSYISVFSCLTDDVTEQFRPWLGDWKFRSCHDSEWRTDGIERAICDAWRDMTRDVHTMQHESGAEKQLSADMSRWAHTDRLRPVKIVKVIRSDDDSYERALVWERPQ